MNAEELPCLNICGFYRLLWYVYYTNRVSDDGLDIGVDGSNLFLIIQLTSQDLSYST